MRSDKCGRVGGFGNGRVPTRALRSGVKGLSLCFAVALFNASAGGVARAQIVTTESEQYQLIARHLLTANSGGTDVQVNNSEVGANKAPTPAPSTFPNGP